jgi:hypothetical protein
MSLCRIAACAVRGVTPPLLSNVPKVCRMACTSSVRPRSSRFSIPARARSRFKMRTSWPGIRKTAVCAGSLTGIGTPFLSAAASHRVDSTNAHSARSTISLWPHLSERSNFRAAGSGISPTMTGVSDGNGLFGRDRVSLPGLSGRESPLLLKGSLHNSIQHELNCDGFSRRSKKAGRFLSNSRLSSKRFKNCIES